MPASLVVKWTAQRKLLEENLRILERLNRRKEEDGDRCILSRVCKIRKVEPCRTQRGCYLLAAHMTSRPSLTLQVEFP